MYPPPRHLVVKPWTRVGEARVQGLLKKYNGRTTLRFHGYMTRSMANLAFLSCSEYAFAQSMHFGYLIANTLYVTSTNHLLLYVALLCLVLSASR